MIEYFRIQIGYKDVYGTALSLDDAIARLKKYPLLRALEVLTKLDAVLSLTSLDEFVKGHVLLLRELLNPQQRSDILKFRSQYRTKSAPRPQLVLFHELQILNAIKLALQHCDDEPQNPAPDLQSLVEVLMILNDHLLPQAIFPEDFDNLSEDEKTDCFIRYSVPNMVFNQGTRLLNFLTRWYDFFFVDSPSLSQRKDYVDLSEKLTKVIGLDCKLFYAIGSALFSHWFKSDLKERIQVNPILNLPTWLKDFKIEPHEYEGLLKEFSLSRFEFQQQFKKRASWEPYFLLPMQAKPLLRIKDDVLCLSRRFSSEKVSSGLYHLLLTKLPTVKERDSFLTFFGFVFESYVNRLLARSFPKTTLAKRHFPNIKHPNTGNEIADAILDYGDSLVLVEAKSTLFSLEGLVSGNPAILRQKFQDIVYDSAVQLNKLVNAIKSGDLAFLGITPDRVKTYFPLVVTLQFFPGEPITYRKVQGTLLAKGLLQDNDIAPIQIAYIEDLERLEIAMASGKAIADLLRIKVTDKRLKELSFGNFLIEKAPEIANQHNQYLESQFLVVTQELKEFLENRQMEKQQKMP